MSADNFLGIVKSGRRWIGYSCCASVEYPFSDCYGCIASKSFEETTELRALHQAQDMSKEMEYGYTFVGNHWLTPKQRKALCPCEQKRFQEEMENER